MYLLLIKMSSMGDVFLSFQLCQMSSKKLTNWLSIGWLRKFCRNPQWHPLVDKVYPIKLRYGVKHCFQNRLTRDENVFETINQNPI